MKVKVVKKFIDKNTKELHEVGSSFSCDENRFKELQGYVEEVKESVKKVKE